VSPLWTIRLAIRAEQDFFEIVRWTADSFGPQQAAVYAETLSLAIGDLAKGPDILGAKRRDEIGHGILTLHVARQGRKGRHFVVFRISNATTIDVLRLLHDSMDLARHLPPSGQ
jgi:toxin ParE1/3/4